MPSLEGKVLWEITNWPGRSGLARGSHGQPFQCPVLEYLSSLFYYEKLLYRTIGLHGSAISAYHVHVDGKPVGQHPLMCSLLSGIFNSRPPQPKYLFVCYFQVILNFSRVKQIDLEEKNLA